MQPATAGADCQKTILTPVASTILYMFTSICGCACKASKYYPEARRFKPSFLTSRHGQLLVDTHGHDM